MDNFTWTCLNQSQRAFRKDNESLILEWHNKGITALEDSPSQPGLPDSADTGRPVNQGLSGSGQG